VVRDPDRATPLSGTFIGFPSDDLGMEVQVRVTRHDETAGQPGGSPRPAEPRIGEEEGRAA
jgi:hypothetical protein